MFKAITALAAAPLLLSFTQHEKVFQQTGTLVLLFILAIGLILAISACCAVYTVLRPQSIHKGSSYVNKCLGKSLLLGTLTYSALILFLIIGEKINAKGLVALPVLTIYALMLIHGFTAVTHSVGEKILSNTNSPKLGSSLYAVVFGSVPLLLIAIIPFAGWLIFAFISIVSLGVSAHQVTNAKKSV